MSSESITVPAPAATPAKAARVEDRIVVARRLVKTYDSGGGAVPGLRGLDLDVRKGGMVAVVGPARGGKTTLPNCPSGVDGFPLGGRWVPSPPPPSPGQRTGHRLRGRADGEPRLGDVPGGRGADEAPSREERAHVHRRHPRQRGRQSDAARHRHAERRHPEILPPDARLRGGTMDGAITLLLVVGAICLVVLAWAGRKRFPLRIRAGDFFRPKTQVAIVGGGLLLGAGGL